MARVKRTVRVLSGALFKPWPERKYRTRPSCFQGAAWVYMRADNPNWAGPENILAGQSWSELNPAQLAFF